MNSDLSYWERFYAQENLTNTPSQFAQYCQINFLRRGHKVFEAGCGNGRDAVFLSSKGAAVVAVDQCAVNIGRLSSAYQGSAGLSFVAADFTSCVIPADTEVFYSRFTLHAISEKQCNALVDKVCAFLPAGGLMLLEFRGLLNELYRLGDPVAGEPDMFRYEGHSRRFIDGKALAEKISRNGLQLELHAEQPGFSPFAGKNETFTRIIARKSCAGDIEAVSA